MTNIIFPLNSSIRLAVKLIKLSIPEVYSSKVLTSGGNDEILGCILNIGRKTALANLANLSFIILKA